MNLNNYLGCGRGGVTVGKCSEEERNIFKIFIGERDYLNNNRPKFKIKKKDRRYDCDSTQPKIL